MKFYFSRLFWVLMWSFFAPSVSASVTFVEDLNFQFEDLKTGKKGNVAVLTERGPFYTTNTHLDIEYIHRDLKERVDKVQGNSNLVAVGYSLIFRTGFNDAPYMAIADTLSYSGTGCNGFCVIFKSGFTPSPADKKNKIIYACCSQEDLANQINYPYEELFTTISQRVKHLPEPSQNYFTQWAETQQNHSLDFHKRVTEEKDFHTLDELKRKADSHYSEVRQNIMKEGVGSIADSEQLFLQHDLDEVITDKYFLKLDEKMDSYTTFLSDILKSNRPFLNFAGDINFVPVHFGVHLYTTHEMCRFCGDSLVAKLATLRERYDSLRVNLFVSYSDTIIPDDETRRPAGFSHMIGKHNEAQDNCSNASDDSGGYNINFIPVLEEEHLDSNDVFQKQLS